MKDLKQVWHEVDLTEEEIKEKITEISNIHEQSLNLQAQAADLKEELKEVTKTISSNDTRIRSLAGIVRNKKEERHITCKIECDYQKRVKNFISVDTGEVVKTDTMIESDFQKTIDFPDEK